MLAMQTGVICCIYVRLLSAILIAAGALADEPAIAIQPSPVGRWKTVDDTTGKAKSLVQIWEANGRVYGKIEQLLEPDPKYPNPRCVRCIGDLKDKPVIGMRILWDLRKNGDTWSGGMVLDPENGKVYHCSLEIKDDGNRLRVRAFLGFSWLGRTQDWLRAPSAVDFSK